MTARKIIPISQVRRLTPDEIDDLHRRLENEGYMRMMQIGEPRLAELVAKYKGKGYAVEVVPYVDDGDDGLSPPSGGCGPGSCSAGASSASIAPASQPVGASPRAAHERRDRMKTTSRRRDTIACEPGSGLASSTVRKCAAAPSHSRSGSSAPLITMTSGRPANN